MTNYILSVGDSITLGADGLGGYVNGGYRITLETRLNTIGYTYTSLGTLTSNSTGMTHPDHVGLSGYRLDEVSPIVLAMSATPIPTYILLCIGTNDIYQSYDLANLNSRLDTFISALLSKWSGTTILVATIGPITGFSTSSYNSHILGLSSATPVDMASVMNSSLQNDGIHPSAIGYSRMGDAWYTALKAKGIFPVANTKITALGSYAAQLSAGDLIPFVDISDTTQAASGTTKKVAAGYLGLTDGSTTVFTGGGTITLGGFTLTVPATGTAALIARAQSFSATQTFTAGIVNNPASTGVIGMQMTMPSGSTSAAILVNNADNGSGSGPFFEIRRNSNASTPASGFVRLYGKTGNANDIWADSSTTPGVLRIGNATGTATDLGGSIVGAQTSWHELKEGIRQTLAKNALLSEVLKVKLYDYQMKGDSGLNHDGSKPTYTGIVITKEDRQNDVWFAHNLATGQTPSLNERNLFGYLIGAIQALAEKVATLEGKLDGQVFLASE